MKIVIVKSTRYDTIEKHQSSLLFIPSRIQFYSAICPVVSSIKAFSGSQMLILKWLPKPFLEVSSLSRRFCLIKTLIKAPRGPARTPDLERSMIQIWFKPSFHMDSPAILKPPKILQFFHVFPIFFLLPTSTTPIRLSACCRLCRILDFNSTRCDWAASTSVTEGGRIMKAPRDGWDDPTETFDVMVCFFWGEIWENHMHFTWVEACSPQNSVIYGCSFKFHPQMIRHFIWFDHVWSISILGL